jgi:DNA-binding transcriptional LysR family regulator
MHELAGGPPWDDVRFFLAAARSGTFGAAGRALGTEQSTVSRRVAALEGRLGGALFDRTPAGLALTRLGGRVLAEAGAMEQALGRLADAAAREARDVEGLVRVALTETMAAAFVIPRVLPALLARHPALRVDLVTGDASADLLRREADVAVRFVREGAGDLVSRRVAGLTTAPVCHRRLLRRLERLEPRAWPWVSTRLPVGGNAEDAWLRGGLGVTPRLTSNSHQAQLEAVRAGLGVAVLPTALLQWDASLRVLPLPDASPLPPLPALDVFLVTRRTARQVPRVRAVWEALETGLREGFVG